MREGFDLLPKNLRDTAANLISEMCKYYEVKAVNNELIIMTIQRAIHENQAIKEIKEKITNVN